MTDGKQTCIKDFDVNLLTQQIYKMTDGKTNWRQRITNVSKLTHRNYYWRQ